MKKKNEFTELSGQLLTEIAKLPGKLGGLAKKELSAREVQIPHEEPKLAFSTDLGELYKGDCYAAIKWLKDASLDCIFIDQPFNLKKDYGDGIDDFLPEGEYLRKTRILIELLIPKLKPGGSIFFYNIPKWAIPAAAILGEQLDFCHWISIDLTLSMPISNKLYPAHYALLHYTKGKPNKFKKPRRPIETCRKCASEIKDYGGKKEKLNPKGIGVKDIWDDIPPVRHKANKNRSANELHPKLLHRILEMVTDPGDVIFDPFGGSGTTCAVAELMGRRWVACELGDCSKIEKRLRYSTKDKEAINRLVKEKDCLFTEKDLKRREISGVSNRGYKIK